MQLLQASTDGTWRDRALIAVVALLFVVPAAVLAFGEKPARYGFQMYSGYGDVQAAWLDSSGDEHPIDLEEYLASPRGEVDWTKVMPRVLCDRIPDAISVRLSRTQPGADQSRTVSC